MGTQEHPKCAECRERAVVSPSREALAEMLELGLNPPVPERTNPLLSAAVVIRDHHAFRLGWLEAAARRVRASLRGICADCAGLS